MGNFLTRSVIGGHFVQLRGGEFHQIGVHFLVLWINFLLAHRAHVHGASQVEDIVALWVRTLGRNHLHRLRFVAAARALAHKVIFVENLVLTEVRGGHVVNV